MALEILHCGPGGVLLAQPLQRICAHLQDGGLAILPTETGYLLGADGSSEEAIEMLYRVKGRHETHAVSLAVPDVKSAHRVGIITPSTDAILSRWTPGPVTVVVPAQPSTLSQIVADDGTIGIRIPDHLATLQILQTLGFPVTATSANRSGKPALSTLEEVGRQLSPFIDGDWLGVRWDERKYSQPSTVVRVLDEELEILREGPISAADLQSVITDV